MTTDGVPFSAFMAEALYGSDGYYQRRVQIGGVGADFYTSAQFPLFGRTLGRYIWADWRRHVSTRPLVLEICEIGPGEGDLAASITEYLCSVLSPDVSISYTLVEPAKRLRELQQARLVRRPRVTFQWCERLEDAEDNVRPRAYILANEVLDALPVERVRRAPRGWQQAYVALRPGTSVLHWIWRRAAAGIAELAERYTPVPVGHCAEVCETLEPFFAACRRVARTVHAIFVDYGIVREEWEAGIRPEGTLRAYANHQFADPLTTPGQVDITADVNWTHAAAAAQAAGFQVGRLQSQGSFLMQAGIAELATRPFARTVDPKASADVEPSQAQALKTLVLPGGMGERFSVLACEAGSGGFLTSLG
ncbi:MAG: SAM-dependent methyltransferase [Alicyclobacillus sp.]|nr:SAM-dependent methyltransferase [Alicyclobacillus sp.]